MIGLKLLSIQFVFAMLRYLPVLVIPAMSPLSWAPVPIRLALLLAIAWLTVFASSELTMRPLWQHPVGLMLACGGELLIGMIFGLAILLPQSALGFSARLADMQTGLSAASLFNPGGQHEPESMLGTVVMLAVTVLFFSLDMHLLLYRMMVASVQVMPLGEGALRLNIDAFFAMLSVVFMSGLSIMAPVILGLLAVDIGVAYATRSMPQANVYFLALPLKVAVGLILVAAVLKFAPEMVSRFYLDAFQRIPTVLGI